MSKLKFLDKKRVAWFDLFIILMDGLFVVTIIDNRLPVGFGVAWLIIKGWIK